MYKLSCDPSRKYKYLKSIIGGNLYDKKSCPFCGKYTVISSYENLLFEISSGKVFPDNIMYGGYPGPLFISQKALEAFEKEAVTGYNAFPISIYEKREQVNYQYYVLEVYGNAVYNYKKMGCKPDFYCEKCGCVKLKKTSFENTYIKEGSWDGSDLFLENKCTDRVVGVIKKYKSTGFMATDIVHSMNPYLEYSQYIKS